MAATRPEWESFDTPSPCCTDLGWPILPPTAPATPPTSTESLCKARAAVTPIIRQSLNVQVQEVDVREPGAGEALVKILFTGICGSVSFRQATAKDLTLTLRQDVCFSTGPLPGFPSVNHIPGHEGIGEIVQCLDDPILVRQIVAVRYLGVSCGACTYCLDGLPTSCPNQVNVPKHVTGTLQNYACLPISCLIPVPKEVLGRYQNKEYAPLCAALCSGSAALSAIRAARLTRGSIVVVSGIAGAIGHMVGVMARVVYGAKVIGIDHAWKNKILARSSVAGVADYLLDAPSNTQGQTWHDFRTALIQVSMQLRDGRGTRRAADRLIICASKEPAFRNMEDYVCDGGRIVCSGYESLLE